jgi:hypothetical protein
MCTARRGVAGALAAVVVTVRVCAVVVIEVFPSGVRCRGCCRY